jgi:hypothetical protein
LYKRPFPAIDEQIIPAVVFEIRFRSKINHELFYGLGVLIHRPPDYTARAFGKLAKLKIDLLTAFKSFVAPQVLVPAPVYTRDYLAKYHSYPVGPANIGVYVITAFVCPDVGSCKTATSGIGISNLANLNVGVGNRLAGHVGDVTSDDAGAFYGYSGGRLARLYENVIIVRGKTSVQLIPVLRESSDTKRPVFL